MFPPHIAGTKTSPYLASPPAARRPTSWAAGFFIANCDKIAPDVTHPYPIAEVPE
jgi:hypothetical protein